jgi:hypothetical protein
MIKPPRGYRILAVGDKIEDGDLRYQDGGEGWCPAFSGTIGQDGYGRYARKVIFKSDEMPKVNLRLLHLVLPREAYALVKRIVDTETWRIRRSRPVIIKDEAGELTMHCACATYMWRMLVFMVSPLQKHQCMPVAAYYYLPRLASDTDIKKLVKQLDGIVDVIMDTIPANQWYGVHRWRGLTGEEL